MNDFPQFLCLGDYKSNFKKEPLEKYAQIYFIKPSTSKNLMYSFMIGLLFANSYRNQYKMTCTQSTVFWIQIQDKTALITSNYYALYFKQLPDEALLCS